MRQVRQGKHFFFEKKKQKTFDSAVAPSFGQMARALRLSCLLLLAAATPLPTPAALAEAAARRFPQPVRVGDLLGRTLQKQAESQDLLGHVHQVVRAADGTTSIVVDYGGTFGLGGRLIAVPVDAMVVVGRVVEIVGLKPEQVQALPTYVPGSDKPLAASEIIKVGLGKPAH